MEFAHALATLLPSEEAKRRARALNELGVRVVRVGTLFERMSYDQDTIAVRAGKPVEFVFENSDLMPHNFVIVEGGAARGNRPGGRSNGPTARRSAAAFRAGQRQGAVREHARAAARSEKLTFTAPTTPGVYPYVCTYPGHWRRMYGALYVVEDLDAYLENPEGYLASHPLEIKDRAAGRSPAANRVEARRPGGQRDRAEGRAIVWQRQANVSSGRLHRVPQARWRGADVRSRSDEARSEMHPLDILKELLDPSLRINEKYQSYVFELNQRPGADGAGAGRNARRRFKIIENPLVKAERSELSPTTSSAAKRAPTSIMPKGLLDKLSREEILDLVAYIAARGNAESPLFKGSSGHAGHH